MLYNPVKKEQKHIGCMYLNIFCETRSSCTQHSSTNVHTSAYSLYTRKYNRYTAQVQVMNMLRYQLILQVYNRTSIFFRPKERGEVKATRKTEK